MTLSVTTLSIKCNYGDCSVFYRHAYIFMLSVIMLSVIMLNVIMLSATILNVIILNVLRLNVIILNIIMLSIVGSFKCAQLQPKQLQLRL
jgi:hypothetical protein